METILEWLIVPLFLLNVFGGIVSGIWLAIIGQWWALALGVVGAFLSRLFIIAALIPAGALVVPAMPLMQKKMFWTAGILLALNSIYTYCVLSAWCMFAFLVFTQFATRESYLPLVIWSYGVATGPWARLAIKEEGYASTNAVFFAKFAYLITGLVAIVLRSSQFDLAVIFLTIMSIGLLIQFGLSGIWLYGLKTDQLSL